MRLIVIALHPAQSPSRRPHKLHIACFRLRPKSALIPLLVLSKSHPLRWAVIWFQSPRKPAPFHKGASDEVRNSIRIRRKLVVIVLLPAGASGTPPPTNRKGTLCVFAGNLLLSDCFLRGHDKSCPYAHERTASRRATKGTACGASAPTHTH